MVRRKITLQYFEGQTPGVFSIIRLAGSGAGAAAAGELCRLQKRGSLLSGEARILQAVDKSVRDLSSEDASALGYSGGRDVTDLRSDLAEMYRFRPQWRGDETVFRLITIEHRDGTNA